MDKKKKLQTSGNFGLQITQCLIWNIHLVKAKCKTNPDSREQEICATTWWKEWSHCKETCVLGCEKLLRSSLQTMYQPSFIALWQLNTICFIHVYIRLISAEQMWKILSFVHIVQNSVIKV